MSTEARETYDFDPQCAELARYFLGDQADTLFGKDNGHELAGAIQDAVERWFEDHSCPSCSSQERDHRGLLRCECAVIRAQDRLRNCQGSAPLAGREHP